MAGFCITNETKVTLGNYCRKEGIYREKNYYFYPAPSGIFAYIVGYDSYEKRIKTNIMKPYYYDESLRGQEVLVKAHASDKYIYGQEEYATLDMDKKSKKVKDGLRLGMIPTVSQRIASDMYDNGVHARIIYLDDLPKDLDSLNKLLELINTLSHNLFIRFLNVTYLYELHDELWNLKNRFVPLKKDKVDLLRKNFGESWKDKYNSLMSPEKKFFFKNEYYHSLISFDVYVDVIHSFFNEENGVHIWKNEIEKRIKKLTPKT